MGMGTGAMGGFAFGYSAPGTAPAPLPPTTDATRLVDPMTGDYAREASGAFSQASSLAQRVLFLLRTSLGSSSEAPAKGMVLPSKTGDHFEAEMTDAVKLALAPLGDQVTIVSITFDRSRRNPVTTVTFSDPQGTAQTVTL